MPSWCGAQKKAQGQLYLFTFTLYIQEVWDSSISTMTRLWAV